jgi:hypothetical protein
MREIKFKAWFNNKMWFVVDINYVDGSVYLSEKENFLPDTFAKLNDENIELLLFTGLLDKQGKEICEGDIVLERRITGQKYGVYEIIFTGLEFRKVGIDNRRNSRLGAPAVGETLRGLEVIGNKYEGIEMEVKERK